MPQPPANPDENKIPAQMIAGSYQILSLLGTGGMGSVYKVRQIFLDEIFALKLLTNQNTLDSKPLLRFQQEGKAARSLDHPNLVKVHDFGALENGQAYLVMDYIEGPTLADYLKTEGSLTVASTILLCKQLCAGLGHAHEKGIIHRDIKPGNIIVQSGQALGTRGGIKIVDFGIAKILADEQNPHQQLTKTGEIFGSPYYMSPEQCLGKTVDQRSDIYSLGCLLFEALAGSPPFVGANALRTMVMHESAPTPSLKVASPSKDFPENIEKVIAKMLAKSPQDRYATVSDVYDEFSRVSAATIAGKPALRKPLYQNTALIATIATISILAAGFAASKLFEQSTSPPTSNSAKENYNAPPDDLITDFTRSTQAGDATFSAPPKSNWNGRPIVSKIVHIGQKNLREFVFPDVPIGAVTTELLATSRNWNRTITIAKGVQDFPTDQALTWLMDFEQFPKGFSNDYIYIGRNEFFGMHLNGSLISDMFSDGATAKQEKFMLAVLKNAQQWTSLRAVLLEHIDLTDEWLQELNKIPRLDNLLIDTPNRSLLSLKSYELFHNVHSLWLKKTEAEPFTNKVRGSSKLVNVVFADCAVTAESIDNLRDCAALRHLQINEMKLSKNIFKHLLQLEQIDFLALPFSQLSVMEVEEFLKMKKLRLLVVSKDVYDKVKDEIKNSRLVFEPPFTP